MSRSSTMFSRLCPSDTSFIPPSPPPSPWYEYLQNISFRLNSHCYLLQLLSISVEIDGESL